MISLLEWQRAAIESQMRAYEKRSEVRPSMLPTSPLEVFGAIVVAFLIVGALMVLAWISPVL